jgi:hypothetical protein
MLGSPPLDFLEWNNFIFSLDLGIIAFPSQGSRLAGCQFIKPPSGPTPLDVPVIPPDFERPV